MTFSKDLSLGWILLVLAAFTVTACRVADKPNRYSISSGNDLPSVTPDTPLFNACAQPLSVGVRTATPSLPASGGVARFTVTVKSQIERDETWIDVRVPAGVSMPPGYPRNIGLVVGEPYEHSFELELPPGNARYDISAGLRVVRHGVSRSLFNNAWVSVGEPEENRPVLTRSGSTLVREVRFGDPLRRDGR